jgi:hypothetical protein
MLVIWGDKLYGKIHQVPGVCHVATVFFHFWYLPIWPMRSYIVFDGPEYIEGSPDDYGRVKITAYGFPGVRIPMSFRSVFMGYFRALLGVIIFYTFLAWTSSPRKQNQPVEDTLTDLALVAGCLLLFWFSRLLTVASPAKAAALETELCAVKPDPEEQPEESGDTPGRGRRPSWKRRR